MLVRFLLGLCWIVGLRLLSLIVVSQSVLEMERSDCTLNPPTHTLNFASVVFSFIGR